jgi:tRNA splicing endonuclease
MRVFTKPEDAELEQEGVWLPYGDGSEFLIARTGTPANRRAYERAQQPYLAKIRRRKELRQDEKLDVLARTLSESVLLNWRGIQDIKGKDLPYSKETAYQVLVADQDVREFVLQQADLAENFREDEVDSLGKESAPGSSGKRKTATG